MATASLRPPWFGNRGVQVLAAGALAYNLVQLVEQFLDAAWGQAFLSFAWSVLFGYVLVESLRFRRHQDAARDEPVEPND
ncbi:MAG TPA: hypothetical protein VHF92_03365 [Geodermatophilus sp.]|nr:hypothetical protein [Geodermatophilus sp.]